MTLALVAIALAVTIARPKSDPGPALRDFEAYYSAGATWRYHADPYGRDIWRVEKTLPGVVATRDELLPFVGPPFGLPLWDWLARLPWPAATIVWATLLVLAALAIALGSLRLAGGHIDALDVCAVLGFGVGFGPLTSGLALGQAAVLATAAVVLVPFALGPGRTLVAAGCMLVAALQPNLALVLAARLAGKRAWIALVVATLVAVLGSLVALGNPGGLAQYFTLLRAHGAAERFITIQTTVSAVSRALGAPPALAGGLAGVVALCVVIALTVQVFRGQYSPNARLALACAAIPLALPFAHEHDYTIALFPAVVALRQTRGRGWMFAALAALLVAVDWIGLVERPAAVASSTLLILAAAFTATALARGRLAAYHFAPPLMAVAVLSIGTWVAGHPVGVWPDTLGPNFHVSQAASAAEVWGLEQIASGLGRPDVLSGALRLMSLLGCALLWAVLSVVLRGARAPEMTATEPASLAALTGLRDRRRATSSKPHRP